MKHFVNLLLTNVVAIVSVYVEQCQKVKCSNINILSFKICQICVYNLKVNIDQTKMFMEQQRIETK